MQCPSCSLLAITLKIGTATSVYGCWRRLVDGRMYMWTSTGCISPSRVATECPHAQMVPRAHIVREHVNSDHSPQCRSYSTHPEKLCNF